ncbi:BLUF domain-containing protein [Methylobacterium iners]|uniref:BLUF domain-containing protein n=1 Tax=Methylobacterium iners TaxID=418707 RepID=A0ABQ4S5Q0_9HYPH|nr:BLUF domain-containing protein [Methylobacterium iners]GJD97819.1 hypothetical protein OCOJLMKI_5058 [Methylobacterium iners]
MSDLYRLVYASKNLLQGSDAEIAQEVSQILEASQRNNTKVDVTGALMFNAGAFAQVLEGPKLGVEHTFERIQCDPRHGDVTVLQCGPVENRCFSNWSMAFVGQSEVGRARWDGIAAKSDFDLSRLDGDAVFAMLHELVMDEEGLPITGGALPTPPVVAEKAGKVLDVEKVRAELPQPGRALDAAQHIVAKPSRGTTAVQTAVVGRATGETRSDAALGILRAALAEERQLTTDLRNQLDEARVALALQQEQSDALRGERDVWAGRAQLLATSMSQEARGVTSQSGQLKSKPSLSHSQGQPSALVRAVS